MSVEKDGSGKCYELILNYNCSARCLFCSQGSFDKSLNAPFSRLLADLRAARKAGYRRLGLTGGEPLIRPDIIRVVSAAKRAGFGFIRVQTNGIRLSDPVFCSRLARAGLTLSKFSFASDRPAEHDLLVGVKGAFARASAGVENLRRLKVRVANNIVVNRLNYRRLDSIIGYWLERGISSFVVIYPVYIGSMRANHARLGVSLPECAPYFRKAAAFMEKCGLGGEILFLNVPPCFLKGRESLAIGLDKFNTLVTDPSGGVTDLDESAEEAKVRGLPCRRCALEGRCRGVDRNYAELYGWRGFRPFRSPPVRRKREEAPEALFFSDNERCMSALLEGRGWTATPAVLEASRRLALCRDCSDGNAVLGAGLSLEKKGLVEKKLERGTFFWRLRTGTPPGPRA